MMVHPDLLVVYMKQADLKLQKKITLDQRVSIGDDFLTNYTLFAFIGRVDSMYQVTILKNNTWLTLSKGSRHKVTLEQVINQENMPELVFYKRQ